MYRNELYIFFSAPVPSSPLPFNRLPWATCFQFTQEILSFFFYFPNSPLLIFLLVSILPAFILVILSAAPPRCWPPPLSYPLRCKN